MRKNALTEPSVPSTYPDLEQVVPSAPQAPQVEKDDEGKTFRLKRLSDIREFLEQELETRGRYRRRYKFCL